MSSINQQATSLSIIEALGGNYSTGMCRCPAHDDNKASLHVEEKNGRVVLFCHAGCSQETVIGKLKSMGLWHSGQPVPRAKSSDEDDVEKRIRDANTIWERARQSEDRPTEYLKGRCINIVASGLKMLNRQDARKHTGMPFPTIVAPIKRKDEDGVLQTHAVHLTFLTRDAKEKVAGDRPRETRGLGSELINSCALTIRF